MNLTTIEMPVSEAASAFREYRTAVRSAKVAAINSEDAQIARAYKALADGKQILNIMDAFEGAGVDALGLPKLAIARADEKTITVQRYGWADFLEIGPEPLVTRHRRGVAAGLVFRFPSDRRFEGTTITRHATVPNIPPHLRPPFDLKNYHLLWEPKWEIRPRPPGDPALLKHIGGPLYAVLAIWDLTPVEQAVLSLTRTR